MDKTRSPGAKPLIRDVHPPRPGGTAVTCVARNTRSKAVADEHVPTATWADLPSDIKLAILRCLDAPAQARLTAADPDTFRTSKQMPEFDGVVRHVNFTKARLGAVIRRINLFSRRHVNAHRFSDPVAVKKTLNCFGEELAAIRRALAGLPASSAPRTDSRCRRDALEMRPTLWQLEAKLHAIHDFLMAYRTAQSRR